MLQASAALLAEIFFHVYDHCCYYVNIMKVPYYDDELFRRWSGCRFWSQLTKPEARNFELSWCHSEFSRLNSETIALDFSILGMSLDDTHFLWMLDFELFTLSFSFFLLASKWRLIFQGLNLLPFSRSEST